MKLLTHGVNQFAMVIFNVLLVISLIGAIALIPGDVDNASRLGIAIVILAVIFFGGLAIIERRSSGIFMGWAHDHQKLFWAIGGIIAVLTVAWQLMMVSSLSGQSWWDPASITQAAILPEDQWQGVDKWYFAYNPNNLLLVEIYRGIANLLGLKTVSQVIFMANYLNVIIVDLAGIVLVISVYKICRSKRATCIGAILYCALLMLWPYVVIPYSDTWAILVGAILIFSYSHFISARNSKWQLILWALVFGVALAFGYLLKPSTVIVAIAITLVHLLSRNRKAWKLLTVLVAGAGITFAATTIYVTKVQAHTKIVRLDSQKRLPLSHYIAMGMVGSGGYNGDQVLANKAIKTYRERNSYNWQLVKSEAINYVHHPISYVRFLFAKQIANTSEGTFGWAREGHFLEHPYNRKNLNSVEQWQQRHLFNRDGVATTDLAGLNILAQLVWVITLGSLLIRGIELDPRDRTVQVLKYTILGGMLFLLIFEGGRSRYMMQFLPYVIVVAAINIAGWYNHRLRKTNNQEGVS